MKPTDVRIAADIPDATYKEFIRIITRDRQTVKAALTNILNAFNEEYSTGGILIYGHRNDEAKTVRTRSK